MSSGTRRWWRRKRVILPALVVIGLLAPLPVSWMVHLAGWRAYDRAVAEARAAGLPTTMAEWAAQQPAYDTGRIRAWMAWARDLPGRVETEDPDPDASTETTDLLAAWQRTPRLPAPATYASLLPDMAPVMASLLRQLDQEIPPRVLESERFEAAAKPHDPKQRDRTPLASRILMLNRVACAQALYGGDPTPLLRIRPLYFINSDQTMLFLQQIAMDGTRDLTLVRLAWQDRLRPEALDQVLREPPPALFATRAAQRFAIIEAIAELDRLGRASIHRSVNDPMMRLLNPHRLEAPWTWLGETAGTWTNQRWRTWVVWTWAGYDMAGWIEQELAKLSGAVQLGSPAPSHRISWLEDTGALLRRLADMAREGRMQHELTRAALRLISECRRSGTMPAPAETLPWLNDGARIPLVYRRIGEARMRIQVPWPMDDAQRTALLGNSKRLEEQMAWRFDNDRSDSTDAISFFASYGFIDLRWPVPGVRSEAAASATAGRMP